MGDVHHRHLLEVRGKIKNRANKKASGVSDDVMKNMTEPIFKRAQKTIPKNYRSITLLETSERQLKFCLPG